MKATYKSYPSNLTAEQWIFIAPYLPVAKLGGRPRSTDLKAVLNAIFYVLISGCSWRMLPGDFPAWQTVAAHSRRSSSRRLATLRVARYFRRWRLDGTWIRIHRYLREWIRLGKDRHDSPSVGIIDSQSIEIGVLTNHSVGYDGGKKVKGRKRHLLVDTMGLVLMVVVTAGNISDAKPEASSPPGRDCPEGAAWCESNLPKIKILQAIAIAVIFNLYRRH